MTNLGKTPQAVPERPAGAVPRSIYDEGCLAAHALDLLGDRWAILVIRELILGPRRFARIRAAMPGISASVLTERLGMLEAGGAVERLHLPEPAGVQVYGLTALGQAIWPVIAALCRWGAVYPGHDPMKFISPAALMLSMKAMADLSPGLEMGVGFVVDGEGFSVRIGLGCYEVVRAGQPEGVAILSGQANAMASAVYGPRPLAEVAAGGLVAVTGDIGRAQAFVDRFHLGPGDAARS